MSEMGMIEWSAVQAAMPPTWHLEGQVVRYDHAWIAQATSPDQSMVTAWGHSPQDAMHNLLALLHGGPELLDLGYLTTVRLRAARARGLEVAT